MRNLDEAIQHCQEKVQEQAKKGCYRCVEEHQQLAEWLKELKAYREQGGDAISRQAMHKGQWIQKGVVGGGEYIYECSECHHTDTRSRVLEVPFCWFCGVRMKIEDEGLTELKYLIDEKITDLRSRAKWEEADAFEKKMRNIIARLEEEE